MWKNVILRERFAQDDVRLNEKEVVSRYFIELNILVSIPLLYLSAT